MLIATDIDGTLLRSDGTISERSAEVLARITAGGGHVALVTGRPVRWLHWVYSQLRAPLPIAVCANGAVVYDPDTDEVLRADPLAPELLAQVCERIRAVLPDVVFAVEVADGRMMRRETGYIARWDANDPTVRAVNGADELLVAPAVKLLARSAGDPDELTATVVACLDGLAEATHSSPSSGLVEISATGVTKAAGLSWLCERLGLTADEVLAFGDMPNDVPMLSWAGRAIAVANAHPAAKAVAHEVTLTNNEDGVAAYLESVL
jgi:Cof subfamily protein (haloacid dehalogenase superfamily)